MSAESAKRPDEPERGTQGLTIAMPSEQPCEYAFALKVTGLKLKE
jgi:hypothetical protein